MQETDWKIHQWWTQKNETFWLREKGKRSELELSLRAARHNSHAQCFSFARAAGVVVGDSTKSRACNRCSEEYTFGIYRNKVCWMGKKVKQAKFLDFGGNLFIFIFPYWLISFISLYYQVQWIADCCDFYLDSLKGTYSSKAVWLRCCIFPFNKRGEDEKKSQANIICRCLGQIRAVTCHHFLFRPNWAHAWRSPSCYTKLLALNIEKLGFLQV